MILYLIIFFILGLIFGSFSNVCISRLPKNESVIKPGSHCPKCMAPIKWFDNIPVISYVLLKAKCRHCKEPISAQYPSVELLTGTVFAAVAWNFYSERLLPVYLLISLILIIISVIDLNEKIIPDELSLPLIGIGLIISPFNSMLGFDMKTRIMNSVFGMLIGGSSLMLIGFIGEKVFKKEAMGGGDVKLLAGLGAVMGWTKIFSILFAASVIGSVFGLFMILTKRIERSGYIPFGPFLVTGAFINFFLPNLTGLMFAFNN